MITQKHWRVTGGVSIACCALLAFWGSHIAFGKESILFISGYWLLLLACLLVSLYCALLDLRYIRAQYAVMRRDLFEDTLGKGALQRAIEEAREDQTRVDDSTGNHE